MNIKMNKQLSLGATGFEKYTKATHRMKYLAEMKRIIPWVELSALIATKYPGLCMGADSIRTL
jgi:hypothetical protein